MSNENPDLPWAVEVYNFRSGLHPSEERVPAYVYRTNRPEVLVKSFLDVGNRYVAVVPAAEAKQPCGTIGELLHTGGLTRTIEDRVFPNSEEKSERDLIVEFLEEEIVRIQKSHDDRLKDPTRTSTRYGRRGSKSAFEESVLSYFTAFGDYHFMDGIRDLIRRIKLVVPSLDGYDVEQTNE